jgi:hypothetical protein
MVKLKTIYLLTMILVFGTVDLCLGQIQNLVIGTGDFRVFVSSVFADRNERLVYPREYEIYQLNSRDDLSPTCEEGAQIVIAARNFQAKAYYRNEIANPSDWTIADSLFPYYCVDATAWYTLDSQHSTVPIFPGAQRYWKQRPTVRIVKGENLSSRDWSVGRDVDGSPDMPTDQMAAATCNTSIGITVTESAWVYDASEFAIIEYIFKYTGNTGSLDNNGQEIIYSDPLNDVYLGVGFRPIIYNKKVVDNSSGWSDGTDDWVDYVHEEDGTAYRLVYGWDSDAGPNHQPEDDEGDPLYFSSGLFTATRYPGMAVLHADRATDDHNDDPDQPHRFHVSYGGNFSNNTMSLGHIQFGNIFNSLEKVENDPSPFDWIGWKNAGKPGDDGSFWSYNTPHATDENRFNQMGTLAFGPYQFNTIGDSVRIIVSRAVGTIDWEEQIDLGAAWRAGNIEKAEKNRRLRSGRDSLFTKIKWVNDIFEPKFQINGGNLNQTLQEIANEVGIPPLWPDSLILSSVCGGCRVKWSEVEEANAYRVYRRDQINFDVAEPSKEPAYTLVYQSGGEDPGNGVEYSPVIDSTVWIDRNVYPVLNYWYYVTALDIDGLESSHYITRTNPLPADNTYGSLSPFDRDIQDANEVHVIPNPYDVRALKLYDWPENILTFVGLPANCRIRIFSQSGALVFTDFHESTEGLPDTRYDWNMRSATDQSVASGMYIYVIDKCKDFQRNDLNIKKVDKFVVIK